MKLGSLASARSAYYDRNATSVFQSYLATVGPHAGTQRWSYTVASGKKLQLEIAGTRIYRITAAAPVSWTQADISIVSGATTAILSEKYVFDNSLTVVYDDIRAMAVTVYASESIAANTIDVGTGGSVQYWLSAKGTLYDA